MRTTSRGLFAALVGGVMLFAVGCGQESTKPSETKATVSKDAPAPAAQTPAEKPVEAQPAAAVGAEANTPSKSENTGKMSVEKTPYGKLPSGEAVDQFVINNGKGLKVTIITYGATITSVEFPDKNGKSANITVGLDSLDDYLKSPPYFGATIGRYGNRIAKGKFTLEGKEYKLATNNNENHLHGGVKGFDKVVWKAESFEKAGEVGVKFSYVSADGEEGYPGKLESTVTYSITAANELKMEYSATTDKTTVANLTNHAYWNLAGKGTILDQVVSINADGYLPVDAGLIPLGEVKAVKDTPMDFTKPMTIGSRIAKVEGGYDHCYVLNQKTPKELSPVATVYDPASGRFMEVLSTEPAVQLYTSNFLDGTFSGNGQKYEKYAALCLETQHYPDSPNQPKFPSTVLKPGETYHHLTIHKFSTK